MATSPPYPTHGKEPFTRWYLARCLPYEDFENTKDLGMDHYEVRSWIGWYRYVTLVLLGCALSFCKWDVQSKRRW